MIEKEQIFKHLGYMAEKMPCNLYWLDLEHKILGANQKTLDSIGALNKESILEKTVYNIYPKDIADDLTKHFNKVLDNKIDVKQEHTIKDITTGKLRTYVDTISPILNSDNQPIGIIGTSIEVTTEKEAEQLRHDNRKLEAQNKINQIMLEKETAEAEQLRLENEVHILEKQKSTAEAERLKLENEVHVHKLENEKHKAAAQEQEKFRKIVGQAVHDLQSPLSSLKTIVKNTLEIPEQKRIALRHIAMSIGDITNHLLNQYKPDYNKELSENNKPQPLLVSTTLSEILSDKRHECKDLPITFEYIFSPLSSFAFIKVEPSYFRRMIINLINNSIDSMPKKGGKIKLEFAARDEFVHIGIEDNGKGIPNSALRKIEEGVPITQGKENGHGVGLTQVRETLMHNHGEFKIFSKVGKNHGTEIALAFPRLTAPNWIAEEINLTKDDIVIILDDDISIHEAWNSRFGHIIDKVQTITIKHFTHGQEVIDYIDKLSEAIKQKLYLLSDYELINQDLNGLQVIEKTKIRRSTLVTSHYTNNDIHKLAIKHAVRILPKTPIRVKQIDLT